MAATVLTLNIYLYIYVYIFINLYGYYSIFGLLKWIMNEATDYNLYTENVGVG